MTQAIGSIQSSTRIIDPRNEGVGCCNNQFHFETPQGIIVCRNCGTEIENVKVSYQKRSYTMEEANKRIHHAIMDPCFPGLKLHLSTSEALSPGFSLDPWRAIRMNNQESPERRSSRQYYIYLNDYISRLELPSDVLSTAWRILKFIGNKRLCKGRTAIGMTAAAVYEASKIQGIPILMHELFDGNVNTAILLSSLKIVKVVADEIYGKTRKKISFVRYMIRLGSLINASAEETRIAIEIYNNMIRNGYKRSKDPRTISGALYFSVRKILHKTVLGMYVTQKNISSAIGITEVSLRNLVKDIVMHCSLPILQDNLSAIRNFQAGRPKLFKTENPHF